MFDSPTNLALGLVDGHRVRFPAAERPRRKIRSDRGPVSVQGLDRRQDDGHRRRRGGGRCLCLGVGRLGFAAHPPRTARGRAAGAVCFGVGMAAFGYCPGTSVAGCGEGRRDAMVGVLGMFAGAALYVAALRTACTGHQESGRLGKDHAARSDAHLALAVGELARCRRCGRTAIRLVAAE